MAYKSNIKLWESEFDNIVSKKYKLQDMNIKQLKLEVIDTYKKGEKITTKFKAVDDEGVKNKSFLAEKLIERNAHLSLLENDYKEFKIPYNNQSVEKVLIQRAVKTTLQIVYDEGLFDNYANADKVLEDFLFVTGRRGDLENVNDNVQ